MVSAAATRQLASALSARVPSSTRLFGSQLSQRLTPAIRCFSSSSSPASRCVNSSNSFRAAPRPYLLPAGHGNDVSGMLGAVRRIQTISKGDTIPNSTLAYVKWSDSLEDGTACGVPSKAQTHEEFKGKKVVIISVPGAYTPTCHVHHIPPFIEKIQEFKSKGVDQIVVIAQNDPFVMSAWGVQNKAKDQVIFASDVNLEFSKDVGSTVDMSGAGFGVRTGRYALIADDLKVTYFATESSPSDLKVSSAEAVLAKL